MNQYVNLLPSNTDRKIVALDKVASTRIDLLKQSDFNLLPQSCKKEYLPHLAYMYSLDISGLSEKQTRDYISKAFEIRRYQGTKWAILEVLRSVGLSIPNYEAQIVEYKDRNNYNFNVLRDGTNSYDQAVKHNHGESMYDFILNRWFEYAVIIKVAISESQLIKAKSLIKLYAPVRCVLKGFVSERKQRDGAIFYDSKYTHGLI